MSGETAIRELQALRNLMTSPGWREYLRPWLAKKRAEVLMTISNGKSPAADREQGIAAFHLLQELLGDIATPESAGWLEQRVAELERTIPRGED